MKVRPSVKLISAGDFFVIRKGRLRVVNKRKRRNNQRQG